MGNLQKMEKLQKAMAKLGKRIILGINKTVNGEFKGILHREENIILKSKTESVVNRCRQILQTEKKAISQLFKAEFP